MLLCQTGPVKEYVDKFLALAYRDADLIEQQLVQMFTTGLAIHLRPMSHFAAC
jgi:hypothetical protein